MPQTARGAFRLKLWIKWGLLTTLANIVLVVIARQFPLILGDKFPPGELDRTRIQEVFIVVNYPIFAIDVQIMSFVAKLYPSIERTLWAWPILVLIVVSWLSYWTLMGNIIAHVIRSIKSKRMG